MCLFSSYKGNYRQHNGGIGNYTIDEHNIRSRVVTGMCWRKNIIKKGRKQANK
jgi:hypothetical protein